MSEFVDVVIDSPNPEALDAVLKPMGAVVVGIGEGGPERCGDGWLVRCFGDARKCGHMKDHPVHIEPRPAP